MKSKKLMAALSALTLGATMMGGMAMTASAIEVTNTTPAKYGGFYVCSGWDEEAEEYTVFTPAPYGMYDGNIASATLSGSDVVLTLQEAEYTTPHGSATGSITSIAVSGGSNLIGSNNTVTLTPDTQDYILTVAGYHTYTVRFMLATTESDATYYN